MGKKKRDFSFLKPLSSPFPQTVQVGLQKKKIFQKKEDILSLKNHFINKGQWQKSGGNKNSLKDFGK